MTYAELICPAKRPTEEKRAGSTYEAALRDTIGRSRLNLEGDWPWVPSWKVRLTKRPGPPPPRPQMIEYLISRTMGNQRRHTASLLAVQSLCPFGRCTSVCPAHAVRAYSRSPGSDFVHLSPLRRSFSLPVRAGYNNLAGHHLFVSEARVRTINIIERSNPRAARGPGGIFIGSRPRFADNHALFRGGSV